MTTRTITIEVSENIAAWLDGLEENARNSVPREDAERGLYPVAEEIASVLLDRCFAAALKKGEVPEPLHPRPFLDGGDMSDDIPF